MDNRMDKEITIVGVGHVFDIGEKIREIIIEENPDAIAIELDEKRLYALMNPQSKKPSGIYSLLSLTQSMIAGKFGVIAGNEMLSAINTAKERNLPLYCIDTDAEFILSKIWKKMELKNKIKLFLSIFLTIFMPKNKIKKEVKEMDYSKFVEEIGKQFPAIKEVLIDERNEYMAKNIIALLEKHNKIVAVVGEGDVRGLENLLKNSANVKTIHLVDYID